MTSSPTLMMMMMMMTMMKHRHWLDSTSSKLLGQMHGYVDSRLTARRVNACSKDADFDPYRNHIDCFEEIAGFDQSPRQHIGGLQPLHSQSDRNDEVLDPSHSDYLLLTRHYQHKCYHLLHRYIIITIIIWFISQK